MIAVRHLAYSLLLKLTWAVMPKANAKQVMAFHNLCEATLEALRDEMEQGCRGA